MRFQMRQSVSYAVICEKDGAVKLTAPIFQE